MKPCVGVLSDSPFPMRANDHYGDEYGDHNCEHRSAILSGCLGLTRGMSRAVRFLHQSARSALGQQVV